MSANCGKTTRVIQITNTDVGLQLNADGVTLELVDGSGNLLDSENIGITVNAGTTPAIGDDSLGTSLIGPGDTIHFVSPDGSIVFNVAQGSSIVSASLNPTVLTGIAHTAITGIDLKAGTNANEFLVEITWTDEDGNTQTTTDPTPIVLTDDSGSVEQWNAGVTFTTTNGQIVSPGEYYISFPDGTTWKGDADFNQAVEVNTTNNTPTLPLAADTTHAIIFTITEETAGTPTLSGTDEISGDTDFSKCEVGDQVQAVPTKIEVVNQVTVTQPDNAPNTVDWVVSPNITLRRGNNGGLYNIAAGQTSWSGGNATGTLWRNDTETTPVGFQAAYDSAIGDNIVDNPAYDNAYITDTATGVEYGPFSFLSWQDGGGGGFSVLISETTTLEDGWSLNKIIQKPNVSCIAANTASFSTTRTLGNGIELREEFRAPGVPQGQSMSSVINPGGQANHYIGSWAIFDLDLPQKADSLTFSSFGDLGPNALELIVEVYNTDGNAVSTQTVTGIHGVDIVVTLPTVIDISAVRVEVGANTANYYRSGDLRFGLNQPFFDVLTIEETESVIHVVNNNPSLSAVLIGVQNKNSLQPLEAVALVRCEDGFYAQASPAQVQIIENKCESDIIRSTGLGFDFTGNAGIFNTNTGAGVTNNLFFDDSQLEGTATIEMSAIPGISYFFSTDVSQYPSNQNINTATLRMTVYDSDGTTQLGTVTGNPQGSADDPISLTVTPTGYSMLIVFEDESPTLANIYAQPPIIDGKYYLGEVQEVSVYENGNKRIVGYLKDGFPYNKSAGTTIEDCPEELLCLEDFECALDNITPSVQAKLNSLTDNTPSVICLPLDALETKLGTGADSTNVVSEWNLGGFPITEGYFNISLDPTIPGVAGTLIDPAEGQTIDVYLVGYASNATTGVPNVNTQMSAIHWEVSRVNGQLQAVNVERRIDTGYSPADFTTTAYNDLTPNTAFVYDGDTFINGAGFNVMESSHGGKARLGLNGVYTIDGSGELITVEDAITNGWGLCDDQIANSPSRIGKPVIIETSEGGGIGAGEPNVSTAGYLMYTEEPVFTRFAAAQSIAGANEPHFVGVVFDGGQWKYSDNGFNGTTALANWLVFTPEATDILFANVTFGNGPVGGSTFVSAFPSAGFTNGIAHVPNLGGFTSVQGNAFTNGNTNGGEFYVEGDFMAVSPNAEKATLQLDGTYKLDSDGSIITVDQAIVEGWEPIIGIELKGAFADDTAAGTAGLVTGDIYQTNGSGAAPLDVAGILMIKQ